MPKTQTKPGLSPRELDALRRQYLAEQKQIDSASKWQLANDIASGINDIVGRGVIAPILGIPGDINQALWDAGAWVNNKIKDVEYATGMVKPDLSSLVTGQRKGYIPYSQGNAYLGSEDIGNRMERAGLVSPERRPKTELAASLVSPSSAAKTAINAPKTAVNMLRMVDNLEAPSRGVRTADGMYIPRGQMGAIENLWHGSPHTFDRFDLGKIGTGEGAQAYGHGAYLAEHPVTAETYAQKLSGAPVGPPMPVDFLHGGKAYKKNGQQLLEQSESGEWREIGKDEYLSAYQDAQATYEQMPKGNLYQTRLAWPDAAREAADPLSPENFLDWDKPLSEQPVKDKVVQAFKARGFDDWQIESMLNRGITGEQANVYLGGINGSETGAKSLLDAGIPGIRYLDASSRPTNIVDKELYALYEKYKDVNKAVDEMMKGVYNTPKVKQQMRDGYIKQLNTQKQTSNYVVFDDKLIDIVSRNNQPIKK